MGDAGQRPAHVVGAEDLLARGRHRSSVPPVRASRDPLHGRRFGQQPISARRVARYSRPGMAETAARRMQRPAHRRLGRARRRRDAPERDDRRGRSRRRRRAPRRTVGRRRAVVDRVRAEPAVVLLVVAVIVWFVVFGRLIWLRHARFATFDFDIGHHDQAIWLLAHGKGFITVSGMPVLGHHLTLAYFAVAPLYWLGGGPQLLNLLQTAALALSAVPIFLYARDRLGNEWLALDVRRRLAAQSDGAVAVLGGVASRDDGDPVPVDDLADGDSPAPRRGTGSFLIAALTWKEDIALAVIGSGIVLLVRKQRRLGAAHDGRRRRLVPRRLRRRDAGSSTAGRTRPGSSTASSATRRPT